MNNKRKTLQRITGIGAVAIVVPNSWVNPVISSVVLPAHAQTSTTISLNDIQNIQIVGQQDDSDPRVTFMLTPNSDSSIFTFTFDVIEGSNINENTVFTLINNPTDGERIGTLSFLGKDLVWSIRLSRLSSDFFDIFPSGEYSIMIQAENSDGSRASANFNINFV